MLRRQTPSPDKYEPTANLYRPQDGKLQAMCGPNLKDTEPVERNIQALLSQPNFPCLAALRSYHRDEYQVGFYREFGQAASWRDLRNDLLFFLDEQRQSSSIFLTFWAVFEPADMSEENFEKGMWNELSWLTSREDAETDWPPDAVMNPGDPAFRFSLGGSEFFVVGMHSQSSRLARRFPYPAMLFNVFDQFSQLEKLGQYKPMVSANRSRDIKLQGDVNPMVEQHGETWETIQFSGKNNPSDWKCPFQFLMRDRKR